jgi:hypothetical protein
MREGREEAGTVTQNTPDNFVIYQPEGVYERRHLCRYLRELAENPVTEAEETHRTTPLSPSRYLPVGR